MILCLHRARETRRAASSTAIGRARGTARLAAPSGERLGGLEAEPEPESAAEAEEESAVDAEEEEQSEATAIVTIGAAIEAGLITQDYLDLWWAWRA